MKNKIVSFAKILWPFLLTVALWRLHSPIWNPNGILSLVPIFYYSLISMRKLFVPFAILICFCLDYNFDTTLFWTAYFCAFYSTATLQSTFNLQHQKFGGLYIFIAFISAALGLLGVQAAIQTSTLLPLALALWTAAWATMWYAVFIRGAKNV